MNNHIPYELQRSFEDSFVDKSNDLEIINDFSGAGIERAAISIPRVGSRRRLTRQFYASIDWESDIDSSKVLRVWETYMKRLGQRRDHRETQRLTDALNRAGYQYDDGRIGVESSVGAKRLLRPGRWMTDHLKLFLSHVSAFKVETAQLKERLADYNIAAFVAHEDIEPNLEWQKEIEMALQEMDAFCALCTEGFSKSHWTNQEIGWALGRSVPTVVLRYEADPIGFISQIQAVNCRQKTTIEVASYIMRMLLTDSRTRGTMGEALAARLARSESFAAARAFSELLSEATPLSDRACQIVEEAYYANYEIRESSGVRETLMRIARRPLEPPLLAIPRL